MRSLVAAASLFWACRGTQQLLESATDMANAVGSMPGVRPGQDEDPNATTVSDPHVRIGAFVQGRNGRVTVFAKEKGGGDPNKVGIVVIGLTEVNSVGAPVGFVGGDKHNMLYGEWNFTAGEQEDIDAGTANLTQVALTSPVGTTGQVEFDVGVVTTNGTVGDFNVSVGDVVFQITLSQWKWCTSTATCKPPLGAKLLQPFQVGAFVDVFVAFRGRAKAPNHMDTDCFSPKGKKKCNVFDLGGGVTLDMTNKVLVDGQMATMPPNFPAAVDAAHNGLGFPQVFKIRMPLFANSASYMGVLRGSQSQSVPWQAPNATDPKQGPLGEVFDKLAATAAKVFGRGGRIRTYSKNGGEDDPSAVDVSLVKVQELDANFTEIGMSMGNRHGLTRLDNETFSIHQCSGASLGGSALALNTSFSLNMHSVGTIRLEALLVTQGGTVGPDGEQWNASAGDLKFNVALQDWHWCNDTGYSCLNGTKRQVGAYVDVYLRVKGKDDAPSRDSRGRRNHTFNVGGNVQLQLTSYATIDGNASATMPEGFPRQIVHNGMTVFVLRFPRFNSTAVLDPLVTASSSDSVVGDGSPTTTETTTTLPGGETTTTYTTTVTITDTTTTVTIANTTTPGAVLVNAARYASGLPKAGGLLAAALLAGSLM